MKRFAVVAAAMIVALMATGVFAQGDDARPRRQMKNVFVFIGSVREIKGNDVTIDIDRVMQPGKGKIHFSDSEWTFKFDKGAKIFKNDSPAEVGDFGFGDRVVIEARKLSARNYEPMSMADEDTARKQMERMRNQQGGPQAGPGEMGGPGMGPGMGPGGGPGMGQGQGMGNRPGMQFMQKYGIPVHGKILEINKHERVLIIKPQIPQGMMNRMRQGRQGRNGGDQMGPPPQDDQNVPPPQDNGQNGPPDQMGPPPQDGQGGPGPNGRPMMPRMPEKIYVKITDDTKIFVNGKPGKLTSFKRGEEVVVMLEPPQRPMPMGGPGGGPGMDNRQGPPPDGGQNGEPPQGGPNGEPPQGGPGMGPGMGRGMMPDMSHPIPAKYLLDMKSAKAFHEKMMKEMRNRRNQGGGQDNGWGPPPGDGNGAPPPQQ